MPHGFCFYNCYYFFNNDVKNEKAKLDSKKVHHPNKHLLSETEDVYSAENVSSIKIKLQI